MMFGSYDFKARYVLDLCLPERVVLVGVLALGSGGMHVPQLGPCASKDLTEYEREEQSCVGTPVLVWGCEASPVSKNPPFKRCRLEMFALGRPAYEHCMFFSGVGLCPLDVLGAHTVTINYSIGQ
jgi:hypothetical protein